MSKTVATLALGAVAASADQVSFYSANNLSAQEVLDYQAKGCFRGLYGGDRSSNTLSLLSCPHEEGQAPFATVDEDAFLCVLETGDKRNTQAVADEITQGGDSVLLQGEQEVVFMGKAEDQSVRPHACCPLHFGKGVIDNALYVPKVDVAPTRQASPDHPAMVRSKMLRDPNLRSNVMPNPVIVEALEAYDQGNVTANVRDLSTNEGSNLRITRNSYAIRVGVGGCGDETWDCMTKAVEDVERQLDGYFQGYTGGRVVIEKKAFREDMGDNIVLTILPDGRDMNNKGPIIVSGSHLDSRNTNSGSNHPNPQSAPGADDNASGSAVHLEMARIIALQNLSFENTIQMMWFNGEEQGLLGSGALAFEALLSGDEIIGMFNSDMIGYTVPGQSPTVSFMDRASSPTLTQSCKDFSTLYLPDLAVGTTTGCCSDQQSFHNLGFPAVGIFETPTASVVYPEYHRVGDAWDNGLINYEQVYLFGKSIFASMLEYAVPTTKAMPYTASQ